MRSFRAISTVGGTFPPPSQVANTKRTGRLQSERGDTRHPPALKQVECLAHERPLQVARALEHGLALVRETNERGERAIVEAERSDAIA